MHGLLYNVIGGEKIKIKKETKKKIKIKKKKILNELGLRYKIVIDKNYRCPLCTERIDKEEFKNKDFIREFECSGLCQGCQETVFGYRVAW